MNWLALSGSFRENSYNTALLRAVQEHAPEGVEVRLYDYRQVPLYDADLDKPPSVLALKEAITDADAVLISTPEYNYGIPGVLKNAIDWASRPAYRSPFKGTPTGMLSAAPGMLGGVRAQQQLRNVLMGMAAPVFPWPEFCLGGAKDKFEDGVLTDERTLQVLHQYLEGFHGWVSWMKAASD